MRRIRVRLGGGANYGIEIGGGALGLLGAVARASAGVSARRVAIISDENVFRIYGAPARASLRGEGFEVAHWVTRPGERSKTLRNAERALEFLAASGLERTDAVVALGGGVVGDLAGLAAALYLRGVPFVQAPTTLLAQIDSSVGGKTGVNARAGKNLFGAFHQPAAVVVDTDTLRTLPRRELTAGWCEAIKQGAVGDRRLFERTRDFLAAHTRRGAIIPPGESAGAGAGAGSGGAARLAELIAAQCRFKASVVAGDERESVARTDARSRRVLNFGHTVGHALEAVTRYRRFRHGEAVGRGMIVAGEISKRLGLLPASELESLRAAVALAGPLPRADDLDPEALLRATVADKKSAGGEVRWVLLEGIGRARIVGGREIPRPLLRAALRDGLA
jgi:3-dehydroquinate synthase